LSSQKAKSVTNDKKKERVGQTWDEGGGGSVFQKSTLHRKGRNGARGQASKGKEKKKVIKKKKQSYDTGGGDY